MHTRKKGKSRSRKPLATAKWVKVSKEKITEILEKLAKEGVPPAKMGLMLRDQYGVPSVKAVLGKSLDAFLKEKQLQPKYPQDLIDLIKKAVAMRRHLKVNKKDTLNRMHLHNVESKVNRLVRYYRGKKLPANWKYVPEEAVLLVK
jgi:small subunit ribosomal protein S15